MLQKKLSTTKLIATLYFLLGLFLFRAVPALDEIRNSMYSNWYTSDSILIKAFHIPGYFWFIPFAIISVILWFIGASNSLKHTKAINIISAILLFVLVVHAFDWLNLFTFCHEWGCSGGLLPTWRLFR